MTLLLRSNDDDTARDAFESQAPAPLLRMRIFISGPQTETNLFLGKASIWYTYVERK